MIQNPHQQEEEAEHVGDRGEGVLRADEAGHGGAREEDAEDREQPLQPGAIAISPNCCRLANANRIPIRTPTVLIEAWSNWRITGGGDGIPTEPQPPHP